MIHDTGTATTKTGAKGCKNNGEREVNFAQNFLQTRPARLEDEASGLCKTRTGLNLIASTLLYFNANAAVPIEYVQYSND